MANDLMSIEFWLTQAAVSAPIIVMLVVGIVICYRQRKRRPRVAKLIGWALLAELVWIVAGTPLMWLAFSGMEGGTFFEAGGDGEFSWMLRMILLSLPGSTITAAIWGTVLWAVLQVDDVREESVNH